MYEGTGVCINNIVELLAQRFLALLGMDHGTLGLRDYGVMGFRDSGIRAFRDWNIKGLKD